MGELVLRTAEGADLMVPHPEPVRSLPPPLEWQAQHITDLRWPNQPVRWVLHRGTPLTEQERDLIAAQVSSLNMILHLKDGEAARARMLTLAAVTALLMGYSGQNQTVAGAGAKIDLYMDAVGDLPAWTIMAARRRWARGAAGIEDESQYRFAPDTAILRKLAEAELKPYRDRLDRLTRLLEAVPIGRAMDPEPMPKAEGTILKLRRM